MNHGSDWLLGDCSMRRHRAAVSLNGRFKLLMWHGLALRRFKL